MIAGWHPFEHYIDALPEEVSRILLLKTNHYPQHIEDYCASFRLSGEPIFDMFKSMYPKTVRIDRHTSYVRGYQAYVFYIVFTNQSQ